jgi:hypothetical protein
MRELNAIPFYLVLKKGLIIMSDIKVKLAEIKNDAVKYSLAYSSRKVNAELAGFKIISALKAETDIVFEIESEQIVSDFEKNMAKIDQLSNYLQQESIQYRTKKVWVTRKKKILSFPIEGKQVEALELIAFIPGELWDKTELYKYIPPIGTRYYFIPREAELDIDKFNALNKPERSEISQMTIFDHPLFESMGIMTNQLSLDEIKSRIGTI